MVYSFGGGYFPGASEGVPYYDREVIEPAGFDFRQIKIASSAFAETMLPNVGPIGEAAASGFRVSTDYLPTKVRFDDTRTPLDIDTFDGLTFVSPRAKDLIERLEPGIHQFEPVEYVRSDGTHIADMFVLFVCQRLDTMDREHTNMILSPHYWRPAKDVARRKPELVPPGTDLDAPARMVFNAPQIGHAHLWRDKHIMPTIYASDTLVEAIKADGLTGFGGSKQEVVA